MSFKIFPFRLEMFLFYSHQSKGWIVRIYHNMTKENAISGKILENKYLIKNHVDMCNVTEVMENLGLNDAAGMTWRWVAMFQVKFLTTIDY